MYIKQNDHTLIKGDTFSTSSKFYFQFEKEDNYLYSKIGLLSKLCLDKKIIHVGCVDHNADVIELKIKKYKWLHSHLDKVSKLTIGVDINTEGIKYISENYGYDVKALDITKPNEYLKNDIFDYILFPDVIEHIGNPVEFLRQVRLCYSDNIKRIIITVPNAFAKKNFHNAKKKFEEINTDHRFWFTPFTLAKVLVDAGYTLEKFYIITGTKDKNNVKIKNFFFQNSFIRKYIFRDSYLTRGTIVLIASL
jgi:hypothetical protein